MTIKNILITLVVLLVPMHLSFAEDDKKPTAKAEPKMSSPKGAKVYIIYPKDGKTVNKKFPVKFGVKKMGVAPAGIKFPNTGHHHLIIDGAK